MLACLCVRAVRIRISERRAFVQVILRLPRAPALVFAPSLSSCASTAAMQRRRPNWASIGRRDDEKRDTRDEFDDMEAFVSKQKRQLGDLKKENERLRSEKNRLRADLSRKSSAVAQLESELTDAKTAAIQEMQENPGPCFR